MTQGMGNAFTSDYSALPLEESKNKIIKIQKTESKLCSKSAKQKRGNSLKGVSQKTFILEYGPWDTNKCGNSKEIFKFSQ